MFSCRISEHSLRLALQLPYALARDAEFLAEVGERRRLLAVQAVTARSTGNLLVESPW
jgi:hypothetical protein